MALDLSPYSAVQTNLFVRLDIPSYEVLKFSDLNYPYTINAESYNALGQLLDISDTTNELRASAQEISIGISGIPNANVVDIIDRSHPLKGSEIIIYRAFFDPTDGQLLSIVGNPAQKFQGVVSNFDISDDLDMGAQTGTVTLTIVCTSIVEVLNNKVTGRRTNPTDQKQFYPTDVSMDNVLALENSNFNFGAA
jgi:hypothetical protein